MKFSVLIAHYNNAQFFIDCFNSLQKQTYKNWEAIILDDASELEEKNRVKELIANDSRFKFFENEKNGGVGFTKKRVIEFATGDICCFVDPDDALTNDALETVSRVYKKKDCIATYSKFYNCDESLKKISLFTHTRLIKNKKKTFLNLRFEVAHLFTFKREIYLQTEKIDEKISSSVDQDLYLKLYEKGNFQYIKQPLYLYRLHKSGVSQNLEKKRKLYDNWDYVLKQTLKRRGINKLHGIYITEIKNIPEFLYQKENTLINKIKRKINEFRS